YLSESKLTWVLAKYWEYKSAKRLWAVWKPPAPPPGAPYMARIWAFAKACPNKPALTSVTKIASGRVLSSSKLSVQAWNTSTRRNDKQSTLYLFIIRPTLVRVRIGYSSSGHRVVMWADQSHQDPPLGLAYLL